MFWRASPIKASVSQCKMKLWLSPEASAFHVFFYQGLLSSQQRTRQSRSSGYESGLGKRHSRPSSAGAEDHSPPGHPSGEHQSQIWKMCLHQKATFKGIKEASTQCSSFFCKCWLAPEQAAVFSTPSPMLHPQYIALEHSSCTNKISLLRNKCTVTAWKLLERIRGSQPGLPGKKFPLN